MKNKLKLKRILEIGAKVVGIAFVLLVGNNTVFGATNEPLQVIFKRFYVSNNKCNRSYIAIMGYCSSRYGNKIS